MKLGGMTGGAGGPTAEIKVGFERAELLSFLLIRERKELEILRARGSQRRGRKAQRLLVES